MQLAPISAFCKVAENRYIAGGNFFDVIPYEGKYDAQAIAVFTYENGIKVVPPQVLPVLRGQVRDVKQIARKDGSSLIAVAVNNDTLRLLK
jgi:enediyne biosynthesis protein E4